MPPEPVHRAAHDSAANFPEDKHYKRARRKLPCFSDLVPQLTHLGHFYFILFITSESLLGSISCRNQYQKIRGHISKPSQLPSEKGD